MNRYKILENDVKTVIQKVRGTDATPLPNWYKKLENKDNLKKSFGAEKKVLSDFSHFHHFRGIFRRGSYA